MRLSLQALWITTSSICIFLHILRQPSSMIVLLFILNICKFSSQSFLASKLGLFLDTVSGYKQMFFFLQIILKKQILSIEEYVLSIFSHLFRSFSVRISAISSWDIHIQPRFQSNIQLPRWYVARVFQICSASVDYKIKPQELEPVKNCEIFWMNNNLDYKRSRSRDLTNECNVSFPPHKFSNLIQ